MKKIIIFMAMIALSMPMLSLGAIDSPYRNGEVIQLGRILQRAIVLYETWGRLSQYGDPQSIAIRLDIMNKLKSLDLEYRATCRQIGPGSTIQFSDGTQFTVTKLLGEGSNAQVWQTEQGAVLRIPNSNVIKSDLASSLQNFEDYRQGTLGNNDSHLLELLAELKRLHEETIQQKTALAISSHGNQHRLCREQLANAN